MFFLLQLGHCSASLLAAYADAVFHVPAIAEHLARLAGDVVSLELRITKES